MDLLVYPLVPLPPTSAFITSPVHTHSQCVRSVTNTSLGLPCSVYDIPSGSGAPVVAVTGSVRPGLAAPSACLDVCRVCHMPSVCVCLYRQGKRMSLDPPRVCLLSFLASLRFPACLNGNQKRKKKMGKSEITAAFLVSACPRDASGPRDAGGATINTGLAILGLAAKNRMFVVWRN